VKTKAELEHFILTKNLATAESLNKRELTAREIQLMPEPVYSWHQQNNLKNVEAALDAPRIQAENKKNSADARSMRIWADKATEEEIQESISEVAKFCQRYPQFVGSYVPNREALISWLREKNLSCVKANLVRAFEDLGSKGRLVLNPSAVGLGTETEISGQRVVRHPELYKLLAPAPTEGQRAKLEQGKMSAAEWKEAHKEDFKSTQASPSFFRALERAIATFRLSNPTYLPTEENREKMDNFLKANRLQMNPQGLQAAFSYLTSRGELELNESGVIEGTVTRYTNLGGSAPGFPPKSDKYSFQKKISSLSSTEYLERINNDPAFREAVNSLG